MREMGVRILACLCVVLAGSVPLSVHAASEGSPSEQAGVSIVQVPVTVVDEAGGSVVDLNASDFVVKDNGTVQRILSMHLVETGEGTADDFVKRPELLRLPRRVALTFDLTFNDPAGLQIARDAALRFIAEKLDAADEASVFTIDAKQGVQMLINFTKDREQVADALAAMGGLQSNAFLGDSAGLVRMPPEARFTELKPVYQKKGFDMAPKERMETEINQYQKDEKRNSIQQFRGSVSNYLDTLSRFARSLEMLPGRKVVVIFSSGFDEKGLAGQTLRESVDTAEKFAIGDLASLDLTSRDVDTRNLDLLSTAASNFSTSDCRIFSIDPSGARRASGPESDATDRTYRTHAVLERLASETGGVFFRNKSDVADAMAEVVRSTSSYYLLTYTAPDSQNGKYHKIDVDVRRPDLKISHKKGYYEERPFSQLSELDKSLQIASILSGSDDTAAVDIAASAIIFPRCEKTSTTDPLVPIVGVVELSWETLESLEAKAGQQVELYLFAMDKSQKEVLAYAHSTAKVPERRKFAGSTAGGGLRFLDIIRLPRGQYSMRAIVRNLASGVCGAALTSPSASSDTEATLVSCLVAEKGQWTNVATQKSAGCYPLTFGGKQVVARGRQEVAPGEEFLLLVKDYRYRANESDETEAAGVAIKLLTPDGFPVTLHASLLQENVVSREECEGLYRVKVPPSFKTGTYALSVEAASSNADGARRSSLPIRVVAGRL